MGCGSCARSCATPP
ncbi:hypothetical protein, partial [Thiocapsa sp.]